MFENTINQVITTLSGLSPTLAQNFLDEISNNPINDLDQLTEYWCRVLSQTPYTTQSEEMTLRFIKDHDVWLNYFKASVVDILHRYMAE